MHMKHVIERERFNKMTLQVIHLNIILIMLSFYDNDSIFFQNVSIVLSPTMRISHRVLNCLFENSHILFDGIQLKK